MGYRSQLKKIYLILRYRILTRNNTALARKIGVRIGDRCNLLSNPMKMFGTEPWLITLGDHVEVSADARFLTHDGAVWVVRELKESFEDGDIFGKIQIGNNVMIGTRTLILPGVTIGNNVIIGAGSIITKDIPSNSVAVGVPAKVISDIDTYIEKNRAAILPLKRMTIEQKRQYLMKYRPEMFTN